MLAELRTKSQITIPKEIISTLGLEEGDKLEIYEKNGIICLMPVTVYPKKYINELHNEIKELKKDIANGNCPKFDNVDDLFNLLDK